MTRMGGQFVQAKQNTIGAYAEIPAARPGYPRFPRPGFFLASCRLSCAFPPMDIDHPRFLQRYHRTANRDRIPSRPGNENTPESLQERPPEIFSVLHIGSCGSVKPKETAAKVFS